MNLLWLRTAPYQDSCPLLSHFERKRTLGDPGTRIFCFDGLPLAKFHYDLRISVFFVELVLILVAFFFFKTVENRFSE